MIWVMYLLFVMMRNEFRHTSWFSLDGVSDLGDVTLVIDDDKRIQAHKVYLATGSVGSSLTSTTGFSWTLRYIWPLLQGPAPLIPQLFQLESLATVSVGSSLSSTTGFSWILRYIWLLV